jgi:hypothetical protein
VAGFGDFCIEQGAPLEMVLRHPVVLAGGPVDGTTSATDP